MSETKNGISRTMQNDDTGITEKIMGKLFVGLLVAIILFGILALVSDDVSAKTGAVVRSFDAPEGTQPSGLAWDGSNLWMSSYMKEGGIYKLNPADGSVLGTYTPSVAKNNGYGGLTYDGTYLWEADAYGGGIYRLSFPDSPIISTIPSPDKYPNDLAWDGSHLWLHGYPSNKIYKISPADGSTVASFDAPSGTGQNAALTYDGTYLWLSGTSKIFKLGISDCTVISSFVAPCSRPESLAWDGTYLWCASFDGGKIYRIAATGAVVRSFDAPEGTQPSGLAWDGSNLWMSSYMKEGGIYKLNPADGSVLGTYTPSVAQYNGYGGLTYDGTYLWEADAYGGGIYKLSLDPPIISTIPSPDKYPNDLAWDGSHLWLHGYPSNKIYKISPADGSTVASFDAPSGTGQNAALTYDGTYLWLSGTSKIFKLGISDCTVISSFVAPCSRPESLAWDGEHLWCASFDKGEIYQIDISVPTPSAPSNLQKTAGDGYVELSWDLPADDGGAPITGYMVYSGTTPGGGKTLLTKVGNVSTYTDSDVINDQTYYYQVSAVNSVGEGEKSEEVPATPTPGVTATPTPGVTATATPSVTATATLAPVPSDPPELKATGGNHEVKLEWKKPEDDGGFPVKGYNIYRGKTSERKIRLTTVGNVLTYTDKNVTNGQTYHYHVCAVNSAGKGIKSNEASATPEKRIDWAVIAALIAAAATISGVIINNFISKKRRYGSVSASSNPDSARVFLDGVDKGKSPVTLDKVQKGTRIVLFSKSGYSDCEKSVVVNADQITSVHCDLKKPETKLVLSAEPTEISADGKSKSVITISVEGENGTPAPVPEEVTIVLETNIGLIDTPVRIPAGDAQVTSILTSSTAGGTATVRAKSGTGLEGSVAVRFA